MSMYNNIPAKVDFAAFKKSIMNTLIPPDSVVKLRPAAIKPAKPETAWDMGKGTKPAAEVEISLITPGKEVKHKDPYDISQKNLQEAIIWSEILGKPVCKRRKRRYYGN